MDKEKWLYYLSIRDEGDCPRIDIAFKEKNDALLVCEILQKNGVGVSIYGKPENQTF